MASFGVPELHSEIDDIFSDDGTSNASDQEQGNTDGAGLPTNELDQPQDNNSGYDIPEADMTALNFTDEDVARLLAETPHDPIITSGESGNLQSYESGNNQSGESAENFLGGTGGIDTQYNSELDFSQYDLASYMNGACDNVADANGPSNAVDNGFINPNLLMGNDNSVLPNTGPSDHAPTALNEYHSPTMVTPVSVQPPVSNPVAQSPAANVVPAENRYKDSILNSFPSPTLALKVLDSILHPFSNRVMQALRAALDRRQRQDNGISGEDPESDSSANSRLIKQAKNKRPENRAKVQQAVQSYDALPFIPQAWGEVDPETLEPCFRYTEYGELLPDLKFNQDQMTNYFWYHPLHTLFNNTDEVDSKNSGLALWIQSVPADSASRYPNRSSNKCRFADCPDPQNTIRKGEYRICFDEQWFGEEVRKDPYHNAGYVHLYCFEKHFDIQHISAELNFQPDTREFPEGKNRMAITRDHREQLEVVENFLSSPCPWPEGEPPLQFDHYPQTLSYKLTAKHLTLEPKTRSETRAKRGGNNLAVHMNDLHCFAQNTNMQKEGGDDVESKFLSYNFQIQGKTNGKRKAGSDDDEVAEDSSSSRGSKRRRV